MYISIYEQLEFRNKEVPEMQPFVLSLWISFGSPCSSGNAKLKFNRQYVPKDLELQFNKKIITINKVICSKTTHPQKLICN